MILAAAAASAADAAFPNCSAAAPSFERRVSFSRSLKMLTRRRFRFDAVVFFVVVAIVVIHVTNVRTQFTSQIKHTLCVNVRSTLNCPAGTRFFIMSQTYGWKTKSYKTDCKEEADDYLYTLTQDDLRHGINPLQDCEGRKMCIISVRNWWQHSYGDSDYLVVTYICDPVKLCYLAHPSTHSAYYARHQSPVSLTECCCVDTGYAYSWGRDNPCSNLNLPADIVDNMCPFGMGRRKDGNDINECQEHPNVCSPGGTCYNQPGRYYCSCQAGWHNNGDWKNCYLKQGPNVCDRYPNICGPGGSCTKTSSGFECNCRQPGYKTTKQGTCLDVNECHEDTQLCSPNGECVNTQGAFRCNCKDGFLQNGNACVDIDECARHPTLCGDGALYGKCINTPGSYRCSCNDGYRIKMTGGGTDGASAAHYHCVDVNECLEQEKICGWAQCINVEGSYRCDCGEGYVMVQQGNDSICDDVNECEVNPNICGGGNCTNIHGSYLCHCFEGFRLNYHTLHTILKRPVCTDVNECEMNKKKCRPWETCINLEGGFKCHCEEPKLPVKVGEEGPHTSCHEEAVDNATTTAEAMTSTAATGYENHQDYEKDPDKFLDEKSKAEHSIFVGEPVVSDKDSNTIVILAIIIPLLLVFLLLLVLFYLYKRRKIFVPHTPGAVLFRLSGTRSTLDYPQNHVNPTYNQTTPREEIVVFLQDAPPTLHCTAASNGSVPTSPPCHQQSPAPPSTPMQRQLSSPRRPNYEPPPPPRRPKSEFVSAGSFVSDAGSGGDDAVKPPSRVTSLSRSNSARTAPSTQENGPGKLVVNLPIRPAPPEPGYEPVAPFRKKILGGNEYYADDGGDHVYEEPSWPSRNADAVDAKKRRLEEEPLREVDEEEEKIGAVGGDCDAADKGYNKPVHPGSKHISTEQLNRLMDGFDDDDDDDEDDDAGASSSGYSRPLIETSRANLYDDAASLHSHGYDEPFVDDLPAHDNDDKL